MDGRVTDLARYDPALRAWRWRRPRPGGGWPREGSMRSGTCAGRSPASRDGVALRSVRLFWPTLMRSDGDGRCARNTNERYRHFSNLYDGHVWPAWAEWLMGFPAGWTA